MLENTFVMLPRFLEVYLFRMRMMIYHSSLGFDEEYAANEYFVKDSITIVLFGGSEEKERGGGGVILGFFLYDMRL